jgi:hypothetical protein
MLIREKWPWGIFELSLEKESMVEIAIVKLRAGIVERAEVADHRSGRNRGGESGSGCEGVDGGAVCDDNGRSGGDNRRR